MGRKEVVLIKNEITLYLHSLCPCEICLSMAPELSFVNSFTEQILFMCFKES